MQRMMERKEARMRNTMEKSKRRVKRRTVKHGSRMGILCTNMYSLLRYVTPFEIHFIFQSLFPTGPGCFFGTFVSIDDLPETNADVIAT